MSIRSYLTLPVALLSAVVIQHTAAGADIAAHVQRSNINGIDVLAYHTAVEDVVTLAGSLPAGTAFAGAGNAAVPTLVSLMLDRGTTTEDRFQIAQKLEDVGAQISFSVGPQMLSINAKCLKKDLSLVLALLAEELRSPAFSPAEFTKAQQQLEGVLQLRLENTDERAAEAFQRAVFPEGHPNRPVATEALLAAVKGASLEEVKRFHREHYGPAHLTLVVVGDVDVSLTQKEIKKRFAGWTGGSAALHAAKAPTLTASAEQTISMPGKTSATAILGQASGLRYRDPDTLALRLGTAILGSGFTGRLMSSVRDKEGLTYGIGAEMAEDTFDDGDWEVWATFAPALLDKGLSSMRREVVKWAKDGVTEQELSARKTNRIGRFAVALASTDGMAAALLEAIERGYEVSWLDQYPQAINALTIDQVNGAIKKYINPDKMVLVKAGSI